MVRGSTITLEDFMAAIIDIAVTTLCDAARPGGYLQLDAADSPEWLRLAIAVPECLTARQRQRVVDAAERAVRPRLGAVAVATVNESLAAAVQFCGLPPFQPRRFMCGPPSQPLHDIHTWLCHFHRRMAFQFLVLLSLYYRLS